MNSYKMKKYKNKTSFLTTFCTGKFPHDYIPTVFDVFETQMFYNKKMVAIQLNDSFWVTGKLFALHIL